MRIGYLFRGFLADIKMDVDGNELSTPDGNATYSWSIEHECHRRGYRLIPLGPNLDAPAVRKLDRDAFAAFSQSKRVAGYERMLRSGWSRLSDVTFPELDLVLIEWRWPIPGRNTPLDKGSVGYQDDLERQHEVLLHYSDAGTPIVVWDLDHKLFRENCEMWSDAGVGFQVIETAVCPKASWPERHRIEPPFVMSDLLQHDIDERMPSHHLGYIGSRYERDETIDKWIGPISPPGSHRVKFWGKWEPADDVRQRWPGINFQGRIGVRDFRRAYSRVAAVPLLAKQSYYDCGFITPRPWEAVLFGSHPIGLSDHSGIDQYCALVARSPQELLDMATHLRTMSPIRRRVFREEAAHKLFHMDVRRFMDVIEGLVGNARVADDSDATVAVPEEIKREADGKD